MSAWACTTPTCVLADVGVVLSAFPVIPGPDIEAAVSHLNVVRRGFARCIREAPRVVGKLIVSSAGAGATLLVTVVAVVGVSTKGPAPYPQAPVAVARAVIALAAGVHRGLGAAVLPGKGILVPR